MPGPDSVLQGGRNWGGGSLCIVQSPRDWVLSRPADQAELGSEAEVQLPVPEGVRQACGAEWGHVALHVVGSRKRPSHLQTT